MGPLSWRSLKLLFWVPKENNLRLKSQVRVLRQNRRRGPLLIQVSGKYHQPRVTFPWRTYPRKTLLRKISKVGKFCSTWWTKLLLRIKSLIKLNSKLYLNLKLKAFLSKPSLRKCGRSSENAFHSLIARLISPFQRPFGKLKLDFNSISRLLTSQEIILRNDLLYMRV
jgi:hypothetical protein